MNPFLVGDRVRILPNFSGFMELPREEIEGYVGTIIEIEANPYENPYCEYYIKGKEKWRKMGPHYWGSKEKVTLVAFKFEIEPYTIQRILK